VDIPTQRDIILEAGFARFRQHGVRRVTMDDIARELRISKKTIYRHFPDKQSLVQACADQVAGAILPGMHAAITGGGSVRDRLRQVMAVLSQIPRHISPAFMADVRSDYPEVWAEIDRRRRAVVGFFEQLFEQGRETGEIRPQIHPKVAQRVMFAVLEHVMVPDVLVTGEFSLDQAFDTVITMITQGVLTTAPKVGRARPPAAARAARGRRSYKESPR
jgi:AcrR family transcriptional regulator